MRNAKSEDKVKCRHVRVNTLSQLVIQKREQASNLLSLILTEQTAFLKHERGFYQFKAISGQGPKASGGPSRLGKAERAFPFCRELAALPTASSPAGVYLKRKRPEKRERGGLGGRLITALYRKFKVTSNCGALLAPITLLKRAPLNVYAALSLNG